MRVSGSFRRTSSRTATGPTIWPRFRPRCWPERSGRGTAPCLPADPIPVCRLADHCKDAAAHAQAIGPDLLDRAACVGVAVGDENVGAIGAAARRLNAVDHARADEVGAAAALGPRLLHCGRLHDGAAERTA